MPPKGGRPRRPLAPQVETEVATEVKTQTGTRVVIALVVGLALGLAAYGYGFGFSAGGKKTPPMLKVTQSTDACILSSTASSGPGRCYPGCVRDADCSDKPASPTMNAYISSYSECRSKAASLCKGDGACVAQICGPEQAVCVKGVGGSTCSRPNFNQPQAQCASVTNKLPGRWLGMCRSSKEICQKDQDCLKGDDLDQVDSGDVASLELRLGQAPDPEFTCSPTAASAPLIEFYQVSGQEALEFNTERFTLEAVDGGYVRGSAGTPYFTNIRLVDAQSFAVVMGPIGLHPALADSSSYSGVMSMTDAFAQKAGQTRKYIVLAKIACQEDAPGELFGRKFRVVKKAVQSGDVTIQATGEALELSQITPLGDLEGVSFKVMEK